MVEINSIIYNTYSQIALLGVLFSTDFATEGFFPSVCDKMPFHSSDTNKSLATNCTDR